MGPTGTWQVVSVASSSTLAQHCFCEAQGLPKHRDQLQVHTRDREGGLVAETLFWLLAIPSSTHPFIVLVLNL